MIYDNDKLEKWNEVIDALGLEGQKSVVRQDKSPIPFVNMNATTENIFRTLCPLSCDVKQFSKMPIPIEIRELVALSVRENYFNLIEVWWDDKSPDAVVVGHRGYWHEFQYYNDSNKTLSGHRFESEQAAKSAGGNRIQFIAENKLRW